MRTKNEKMSENPQLPSFPSSKTLFFYLYYTEREWLTVRYITVGCTKAFKTLFSGKDIKIERVLWNDFAFTARGKNFDYMVVLSYNQPLPRPLVAAGYGKRFRSQTRTPLTP
jgi:hypothetical protein